MPSIALSPLFSTGDKVRRVSDMEEGVVLSVIDTTWVSVVFDGEEVDCCFDEILPVEQPAETLEGLKAAIIQSFTDCENALATAKMATNYALLYAYKCGTLLNRAKEKAGHGNWESWRKENIIIDGKPIPSSTASLYQRVADNWNLLMDSGAASVREAEKLLRKQPRSGGELPEASQPKTAAKNFQVPVQVQAPTKSADPNWFTAPVEQMVNISLLESEYQKLAKFASDRGISVREAVSLLIKRL